MEDDYLIMSCHVVSQVCSVVMIILIMMMSNTKKRMFMVISVVVAVVVVVVVGNQLTSLLFVCLIELDSMC